MPDVLEYLVSISLEENCFDKRLTIDVWARLYKNKN